MTTISSSFCVCVFMCVFVVVVLLFALLLLLVLFCLFFVSAENGMKYCVSIHCPCWIPLPQPPLPDPYPHPMGLGCLSVILNGSRLFSHTQLHSGPWFESGPRCRYLAPTPGTGHRGCPVPSFLSFWGRWGRASTFSSN